MVIAREDHSGQKQLVGYVIPRPPGDRQMQAETEQISHWQELYDSYRKGVTATIRRRQVCRLEQQLYRRSYSLQEMQIWVDETVARLMELRPRRVLEIGCGTGLLLTQVAPHCESYTGLDFSAAALRSSARLSNSAKTSGTSH